MSLKYAHPQIKSTEIGKELWESATRWTKDVPATDLSTVTNENFRAILEGVRKHGSVKNPIVRGRYLEMCVYDTIARVISGEGGDTASLIRTGVDVSDGYHAEADFLVNDKLAVLVKVSYRERWKQIDRDVLVMTADGKRSNHNDFRAWSLFNSEQDGDNTVQAIKKANNVQTQCFSGISVATIKDPKRMNDFIEDVRWAVRG